MFQAAQIFLLKCNRSILTASLNLFPYGKDWTGLSSQNDGHHQSVSIALQIKQMLTKNINIFQFFLLFKRDESLFLGIFFIASVNFSNNFEPKFYLPYFIA